MRHGSGRARSGLASAPAYYEWKVQGHPLSIQLSFAVIDKLEADIMKGFWSVPKRGAEVGGVLFGRVAAGEDTVTVYVDDYEAVPCEYRRGPSYVLSESDRKRLERTLRRGDGERQVVGFYRSNTRLGLYLDQDDYALIQSCFANPNHVMLLVRPHASKTSVAGFFVWEEGAIHRQSTYQEFPFSSAEILKRQQGPTAENETAQPAPAASALAALPAARPAAPVADLRSAGQRPAPRTVPAAPQRPDWLVRAAAVARTVNRRGIGLAAAVIFLLVLTEYQVLRSGRHPAQAAGYAPALRIQRDGGFLQVKWNRQAQAVLDADRGLLEISDGGRRRELQLNSAELRNGSVAYAPATNDVRFRLDLVGGRTTVSESLRVVEAGEEAAQPPAEAQRQSNPTLPAQTATVRPAPAAPDSVAAAKPQARIPQRRAYFDDGL